MKKGANTSFINNSKASKIVFSDKSKELSFQRKRFYLKYESITVFTKSYGGYDQQPFIKCFEKYYAFHIEIKYNFYYSIYFNMSCNSLSKIGNILFDLHI